MSDPNKAFKDSVKGIVFKFLTGKGFNLEVDDSRISDYRVKFNDGNLESELEIRFDVGFSNVICFKGLAQAPFQTYIEVETYMNNYFKLVIPYPIPKQYVPRQKPREHLIWSCIEKLASIAAALANDGRGAHDDGSLGPQRPRDGQLDEQRAVVEVGPECRPVV